MVWKEKQMKNQRLRTAAKQGLIILNRGTNMKNLQRKETIVLIWSFFFFFFSFFTSVFVFLVFRAIPAAYGSSPG